MTETSYPLHGGLAAPLDVTESTPLSGRQENGHSFDPSSPARSDIDPGKFGELLLDHIPSLRRYARGLTRDSEAADDLVQEALTRAISKRHLWRPGSSIRAWAFTILHNVFVNQCRHAKIRSAECWEDQEHKAPSPANQTDHLTLKAVEHAHARLPEKQREIVMLVAVQGLDYEEAARIVGVPVGTVRSRLSRARQLLRQMLSADPDR